MTFKEKLDFLEGKGHYINELRKFQKERFLPTFAEETVTELLALYNNSEENTAKPTPSVTTQKQVITEAQTPNIIVMLRQKQRLLRDERRAIHLTLEDTKLQSLRADKCTKIRQLTTEITKIIHQLDDYDNYNILPIIIEEKAQNTESVEEIKKEKKYITERISRLKTFLKKDISKTERKKYTSELAIKTERLTTINNILKT